jgi:two-component system chemotaxis response regulator CheY
VKEQHEYPMKTCLIVDDSRTIRGAVRRLVTELGFDTREAANGAEGIEACRNEKPDVVLLDWNMPVMNGMEFLQALPGAMNGELPPIILCTTESSLDHIVEALAAGANEYIMKPFDKEIVESKFRQIGLIS